ncbi:Xanthine/uracil/vitamin C permease [Sesbania bispinosa]|nr:Xanthine/uracil/vitamin C permease [Sesbania bispinosa]
MDTELELHAGTAVEVQEADVADKIEVEESDADVSDIKTKKECFKVITIRFRNSDISDKHPLMNRQIGLLVVVFETTPAEQVVVLLQNRNVVLLQNKRKWDAIKEQKFLGLMGQTQLIEEVVYLRTKIVAGSVLQAILILCKTFKQKLEAGLGEAFKGSWLQDGLRGFSFDPGGTWLQQLLAIHLEDKVGSYHASSLLVASRPPTRGVLSRGIGLEGLSSVLAGKVGGFIASIPEVMVAGLLCFMWAMLTALGLSNLRYSEAGSSRNIIILGYHCFFSLSIPAYFQQYGISPNSNLPVPSYFQPYIVASHGPFRSKYGGLNYVLNTIFSLHMVIAFLVAVILDNTVPGSKQERGVYVWSEAEVARREPAVASDYELPLRVGRIFRWVKWVGL